MSFEAKRISNGRYLVRVVSDGIEVERKLNISEHDDVELKRVLDEIKAEIKKKQRRKSEDADAVARLKNIGFDKV